MRKSLFSLLILLLPLFYTAQTSQYIEWMGEDEIANQMVRNGLNHFMNVEFAQSVIFFKAAVKQDPSLFAPHVQLSLFTSGDQREYHKAEALKLVKGKNEVSQLFASLLNIERAPGAGKIWRSTWEKMHELAPDGRFVSYRYAQTIQDADKRLAAFEELLARSEKAEQATGHIHNMLGYAYTSKKDMDKAKMHFEKYLEVRPEGFNAWDSMAEFYYNSGDLEKSLEYYKKALELYPMAINAGDMVEQIEKEIANKDLGDLIYIQTEYVIPEFETEYKEWGKEYKKHADKDQFTNFNVMGGSGYYQYVVNVGKDLSGVDDYIEAVGKWHQGNSELGALYEKYKHTVSKREYSVWRHMPNHSYVSEVSPNSFPTYSKIEFVHLKSGSEKEAMDVLTEFRSAWEAGGVDVSVNVYKNVFGDVENCIAIVTNFKSPQAWVDNQEDIKTKVGPDKRSELNNAWSKYIESSETVDRYPQEALSHINPSLEN